jgi:hypothetical protein
MYALKGLWDFGISMVRGVIEGDGADGGVLCAIKAIGRNSMALRIGRKHLEPLENEITMR